MDYHEASAADADRTEGGTAQGGPGSRSVERSPLSRPRSLSDGGGTPGKLSPSPHIVQASRRAAKDDSSLGDPALSASVPVTPQRSDFSLRGLSLQMPQREAPSPQHAVHGRPAPLSPKLDHSQIYASPTNILPRRSRGLDFSRAATSLHHSMLAEQSSPDSSPTMGGRAVNIPGRGMGDYGAPDLSNSLWSIMGNQERMNISSSLGSNLNQACCSDSSSSSDEDDFMDEDTDEAYVTTPQVNKVAAPAHSQAPGGWTSTSPAANSLLSFQQRQRPRKQPKRKLRGPLGLGFTSIIPSAANLLSKSPPNNAVPKDPPAPHSRRESISWAANQLHISGSESDDSPKPPMDGGDSPAGTPTRDGQRGVIRRVVTRRGNLLPKTKGFARIRAALAEESTPVEAEVRREAEVVRQVRESDMDLETLIVPPTLSAATTAHSSPNLPVHDNIDEMSEDAMITDAGLGLSSSFKQQMLRNSKGRNFWETFPDAPGGRTTPPPPFFLPRGSSGGSGLEDMSMDSPSAAYGSQALVPAGGVFPMTTTTSSSGGGTPQPAVASASSGPPSAAEITRRINSKRRRDDDFDPVSFKRRAVSPGMSVHNSPIMQSPLQRDMAPWGSRPGSNGGDRAGGGSGAPSESGSQSQGASQSQGRVNGGKARVGFQVMVDANDGITRLSIE